MAKKKQVKSVKLIKAAKPAQPVKPVNTKTAKPRPTSQGVWSDVQIGQIAGEVWMALMDGNGQSMTSLKSAVGAPPDMVMAAIGWLAREGKLEFNSSGRTAKVSLRK